MCATLSLCLSLCLGLCLSLCLSLSLSLTLSLTKAYSTSCESRDPLARTPTRMLAKPWADP